MLRIGSCEDCKRTNVPVVKGKLAAHGREQWPGGDWSRCGGTGKRSVEDRGKDRDRRRAQVQRNIDARRGDASVLLDALLSGRRDLDHDETLAVDHFRKLAKQQYKLSTGKPLGSYGTRWSRGRTDHKVHCAFCGQLIATIPFGYWALLSTEERTFLLDRHTTLCALQVVSGIRQIGTSDDNAEPLLIPIDIPDQVAAPCTACNAPIGLPCFSVSGNGDDRRARLLKRVHPVRWTKPLGL